MSDQHLLDLLVDGELSEEDELAVLSALEQSPDGWRRCALAFLEARCWQRATVAMPSLAAPAAELRAPERAPRQPRSNSRWWLGTLALAAVFLLAFGIGTFLPNPWHRVPTANVIDPRSPATPVDHQLAAADRPVGETIGASPEAPDDLYLGNLTLVNDSGRTIDVPVYDWNQQVAEQLMYQSPPVSSEVFQQLKRHQVRSYQSYVRLRLKDGRKVVVPVQELDITPVAASAY